MLIGHFNGLIDNLVCYYLSALCIISITVWMIWAYTHSDKWQKIISDCIVYLVTIVISVSYMIIYRNVPAHQASNPLFFGAAWFAFAILTIMEFLWLSYAIDNVCLLYTSPSPRD